MKAVRSATPILIALLFWAMCGSYALADDTLDSITAWQRWKSIDSAIELRPLDGPEDIIEKAEIIEDRVDALTNEKTRLEAEIELSRQKLQTLNDQRDTLQQLDEIKQGGDMQIRQRLHDLTDRIQREQNLLEKRVESVGELCVELARMRELAAEYREKARLLKLEEGGVQ